MTKWKYRTVAVSNVMGGKGGRHVHVEKDEYVKLQMGSKNEFAISGGCVSVENFLNKMGQKGWELVSVYDNLIYLKRQVESLE